MAPAPRLAATALLVLLLALGGACCGEPPPERPAIGEPVAAPVAAPASLPLSDCTCVADAFNCPDFPTAAAAQACFRRCLDERGADVHRLDRDGDGRACEWNP